MIPPIPRSQIADMRWPAVVEGPAADMLAMQYQFLRTDRLEPDDLRARQFEQLDTLVDFCARTMPFHRARLAEAGYKQGEKLTEAVFTRLPILTRADIAAAGGRLHGLSLPTAQGEAMRATIPWDGGRGLTILATRMFAFFNEAFLLRHLLWHQVDFRARLGRIAHDPATAAAGAKGSRERDWGPSIDAVFATGPAIGIDTERPVAEQAAWLAREKPDYLSGPPAALAALATHFRASGRPPRLRGLFCDGIAPPELPGLCRDAFGHAPGVAALLPELGCFALQCPEHGGLHVMAEGILAETLDQSGQPSPPGETGRLVLTTLQNLAMPLLRYDTGLRAALGPPCGCGRRLPVINIAA